MASIPDTVRPGDVISSDLLNRMITLLNAHDAVLAGSSGPLSIGSVLPTVLRMGEELKVFGTGLDVSTLKRITVEGTDVPITSLNPGGSSTMLSFNVPPILGIPDTGKTVALTVENKAGATAVATFYLLPGISTTLEATFNITRTTVSPAGNLTANATFEFTFAVEAYTSRDETYLIQPVLLNPSAGWSVAVKGGATEMIIPKSQPTPSTTPVILQVTTGPSGSASLALGIKSKSFPGKGGSSQAETLSLNAAPPAPNTDVVFLSPTVLGSVQKYVNGSLYVKTDASPANQFANVNVDVKLKQPGVYNIGNATVSNGSWAITILNSPTSFDTTGTPDAIKTVKFKATAQAGAPDANVEIPLTGAGPLPDGSFKFMAKLRADPNNPNPL